MQKRGRGRLGSQKRSGTWEKKGLSVSKCKKAEKRAKSTRQVAAYARWRNAGEKKSAVELTLLP